MIKNKLIIVLGAGESGVGTAVLAAKQGFDVFVSDFGKIKDDYRNILINKNISFEEGSHNRVLEIMKNVGKETAPIEVVKSPGIADSVPIIKSLREKGIPVISEIEFAGRYTSAKTICITGSNGKTTTTMLTYHILRNAGYNVGLAGNVGKSFAMQVAEDNFNYYVLEISSFQLDGMYSFRADIAIITNITPDHLDRYDYKFQNYVDSKFRILQNQTENDFFIFWAGDSTVANEIEKRGTSIKARKIPFDLTSQTDNVSNYAFVDGKDIIFNNLTNKLFLEMETNNLPLKGNHNLYNSMAAGLASQVAGVSKDAIRRSLETFEGVEHRMEYVATVRGVRYINDSKATNVNSCWYALQSMTTPVVLILGGTDKGNDYSDISELVSDRVHHLIFLGVDNDKLIKFFGSHRNKEGKKIQYSEARSMEECVQQAYKVAQNGDTVLLSPCCASFDLFNNYEDRGRQFKEAVRRL